MREGGREGEGKGRGRGRGERERHKEERERMSVSVYIPVFLCRQKVTLWQHADELEQEQLQMGTWVNSKQVTECMECACVFTVFTRKVCVLMRMCVCMCSGLLMCVHACVRVEAY